MIDQPSHELYLEVYEGKQILNILEREVKSDAESIINSMDLARLVAPHIQKGTFKRNQRQRDAWSKNYPVVTEWQLERVAKVIEHYAVFDERLDTSEPIVTWAHGQSSSGIDWTQNLTDVCGDRYEGNLDFTLVPDQKTDNFFNALAVAFEPPKEWNNRSKQWWYDFDYVSTYDSVKKGTYSVKSAVEK